VVFQDPFTSLNPGLRIGLQVAEPLIEHLRLSREQAMKRAVTALNEVGLPHPERLVNVYPHQLSGGMQQRVLIATALVCDPRLVSSTSRPPHSMSRSKRASSICSTISAARGRSECSSSPTISAW
jgi:ABC-type microcin C transport system duplicated ATPase subunit YejF